ncbi:MAG: hemerythrin domain-containing protein [Ignavibacterium album]|mgnify:CR=1 FL=1|uniref:Hemerythrin-like domain-containing protein n=1 Tax=Ignavibacterium album TaxID=591197 RepID=A0A7V3E814_9BACT|nr:hemerythrin domain-containing protein [Ignavibacterium album]MCX8106407.1 hemerythrin domain-containing protein [Ignavibacterium album]
MKINNIDELKKLEIDDFTERLFQLHKSLLDEKRFSVNLYSVKLPDDRLVKDTAERLFKELKHHIYKEENILFPYLINLSRSSRNELPFEQPYFESVKNPIEILKSDHELIKDCVDKLKDFMKKSEVNSQHKISISEKLKNFLEDVERVIYLEDEILFPRAIQIEKSLLKK